MIRAVDWKARKPDGKQNHPDTSQYTGVNYAPTRYPANGAVTSVAIQRLGKRSPVITSLCPTSVLQGKKAEKPLPTFER